MSYLCFSGDVARLWPTATGPCGALTPGEESSDALGPRGRQMCLLEVASARASPVKLGSNKWTLHFCDPRGSPSNRHFQVYETKACYPSIPTPLNRLTWNLPLRGSSKRNVEFIFRSLFVPYNPMFNNFTEYCPSWKAKSHAAHLEMPPILHRTRGFVVFIGTRRGHCPEFQR